MAMLAYEIILPVWVPIWWVCIDGPHLQASSQQPAERPMEDPLGTLGLLARTTQGPRQKGRHVRRDPYLPMAVTPTIGRHPH